MPPRDKRLSRRICQRFPHASRTMARRPPWGMSAGRNSTKPGTSAVIILRSIAPLYAAIASASIMTFSAIAWVPSFFIRRFGWTAVQIGHNFGLLIILSGVIGLLAGGLAGDLAIRSGMRNGHLTIMLIFSLAAVPFAIAAPLVVRFRHLHPAAASSRANVGLKGTTSNYLILAELLNLTFEHEPGHSGFKRQIRSTTALSSQPRLSR